MTNIKCPSCGNVLSSPQTQNICARCGAEAPGASYFANQNAFIAWLKAITDKKAELTSVSVPVSGYTPAPAPKIAPAPVPAPKAVSASASTSTPVVAPAAVPAAAPVHGTTPKVAPGVISTPSSNSENLELPGPVPTTKSTAPSNSATPVKAKTKKKSGLKFALVFVLLIIVAIGSVVIFNMMNEGNTSKTKSKDSSSKDDTKQTTVDTTTVATTAATTTAASTAKETTKAPTKEPTKEPTKAPTATPKPQNSVSSKYKEVELLTPVDKNDKGGNFEVLSLNDEVLELINIYSPVEYVPATPGNGGLFYDYLDPRLASGEDVPDLICCDGEYVYKYMASSYMKPVNELGISYDELTNMYDYTLSVGSGNNIIKGLSWQCCPGGVFYNKEVASNALGVSTPEDVATFFKDWAAFLDTAYLVNQNSNGQYKVVSGWDETYTSYVYTRHQGWEVNGNTNLDPAMLDLFDLAYELYKNDLTWNTSVWDSNWYNHMNDNTVLSYWGPMWMGRTVLNLEASTTEWGFVPAPTPYYWGGSFLMVSKYSDKDATAAKVIRNLTLNENNLKTMVKNGEFINNKVIMNAAANSSDYNLSWLGGQNPYKYLTQIADNLDYIHQVEKEETYNNVFKDAVNFYITGDIATVSEAEDYFISQFE